MTITQTRPTTSNRSTADTHPGATTHQARRAVAAVGLGGIALIHALDLPGKITETPYLGVGYIGLIVSALILAEMVLRKDDKLIWIAIAGLALAVIAGFVVNRTTGMPGAMDDIGNWLEPLGLASLVVEAMVVLTVLGRFRGQHATFS
jgi:hypothetical protein